MEEKTNNIGWVVIAIVAIVAIVGLVLLFLNFSSKNLITGAQIMIPVEIPTAGELGLRCEYGGFGEDVGSLPINYAARRCTEGGGHLAPALQKVA